jgi:sugar/nucleoside kinase (ribokinase family)
VPDNVARASADSGVPVVSQSRCANRLSKCDIVVASDQNFDPDEGKDRWGALSQRNIVTRWLVITLCTRGVWATDGNDTVTVPITQAQRVIDTTGAGDTFPRVWCMLLRETGP